MTAKWDWEETEEYKTRLADLVRVHEIAAELRLSHPEVMGKASAAINASDYVRLDMEFSGAGIILSMQIADLAFKWVEERDPYYMDKASMICAAHGIEPPRSLTRLQVEASVKRYSVGYGALASSSGHIERKARKERALLLMANLIYHGATEAIAASKASKWMKDNLPAKPLSDSSLEVYYSKEFRKTGKEEKLFSSWDRTIDDKTRRQWEEIAESMQELPEIERGSRRS